MLNTKQTNRTFQTEWYYCDRCDNQYPRKMVIVQNGLVLCQGAETNNCVDQPGRDKFVKDYPVRVERAPDPLPVITEDL